MHLSRSADYALRAMIFLAGLPAGVAASGGRIAAATGIAEPFLLKVLRLLVRSRLIRGQRGVGGGFQLVAPAHRVSMLQVIEAVDGPIEAGTCLVDDQQCDRKPWCGVHVVLAELHGQMLKGLRGTSIESLRRDTEIRHALVTSINVAPPGRKPRKRPARVTRSAR